MSRYDAIIVGAGPAGATCAWFLARAGRRVLVVDRERFPRDKACGDAISRTRALPVLQAMGLADAAQGLATARCTGLLIAGSTGPTLRLAPAPGARYPAHLVCRRAVFDAWLLDQVRPHAEVREGTAVTKLLWERGRAAGVALRQEGTGPEQVFSSRLVVGADGAHSLVARQAGLRPGAVRSLGIGLRGYMNGVQGPADQLEFYYLDRLRPGYFWVFPLGGGRANVGLGLLKQDVSRRGGSLAALFRDIVEHHPVLRSRLAGAVLDAPLRGWPLTNWHGWRRRSSDGVLLIGDAAWLVDPVTGEGIGNAMVSARLAAETAHEMLARGATSRRALRAYDRRLRQELGSDLRLKRALQYGLMIPGAMDALARLVASHAALREWLSALVTTPYAQRRRLVSVRGLVRWVRGAAAPTMQPS